MIPLVPGTDIRPRRSLVVFLHPVRSFLSEIYLPADEWLYYPYN
jgi:hypothetical protein